MPSPDFVCNLSFCVGMCVWLSDGIIIVLYSASCVTSNDKIFL